MVIHLQHSSQSDHDEGRIRARIFGEQATSVYPGEPWTSVESQLAGDWGTVRGDSQLSWPQVRSDAHAAWQVAKLEREGHLRDDAPVFASAA